MEKTQTKPNQKTKNQTQIKGKLTKINQPKKKTKPQTNNNNNNKPRVENNNN